MKKSNAFWGLAVLLLFSDCASAPTRGSQQLELHWDQAKNGTTTFHLTGGALGSANVDGVASVGPDNGTWTVTLTRLEWFNNWPNGWTQATFLLDGTGVLRESSDGWILKIDQSPKLDAPESAAIRYFDTYVREDKGLAEFSHRWQRIQAVCIDLPVGIQPWGQNYRALEQYLFPEVYGYDIKTTRGSSLVPVVGIEWDSQYTKDHFSEKLRVLRNSGTLYRDYQESPGLWYLQIAWSGVWEPGKETPVEIKK